MYQFELKGINSETAFSKASSVLDIILSQFNIEDMHGIISCSIEVVINQFLKEGQTIDIDFLIDHQSFMINFNFGDFFDKSQLDLMNEDNIFILHKLADEITFNSDNKGFTILFHVKRKPQREVDIQQEALLDTLKSVHIQCNSAELN